MAAGNLIELAPHVPHALDYALFESCTHLTQVVVQL